jgi:chemotaxis protein MotB
VGGAALMRGHVQRRQREEEEESVFVSMTDMTISFLIILMILLAFFASRFTDDDMVPRKQLEEVQALVASLQGSIRLLSGPGNAASMAPPAGETESAGDATAFEETRQALRARIAALEAEVDRPEALSDVQSLAAARAAIDDLNRTIEDLLREVDRLRPLEAEVEALRARVAELEAELAALRRPDPLEEYLSGVASSRRIALETLRDAIRVEFPDLEVVISSESDALRFQGEGLFASGSTSLSATKRQVVERIAELLDQLLPCYSLGARSNYDPACNPGFAIVEAVQIEGHTDDVGSDIYNIGLGSGRAVSTYGAMTSRVPALLDHLNIDREPVLSIAGYGESRPVAANDTTEGRATNRRIDLRFIMYSPARSEEIGLIRARLLGNEDAGDE